MENFIENSIDFIGTNKKVVLVCKNILKFVKKN